jgi:Kef-type K+ transport system membrane component KefB
VTSSVAAVVAVSFPDDAFADVAVILLVSALVGAVAARLHQPLVVGFVFVGVLVGPSVLGIVQPGGALELPAELGVAILLFVVGLRLDLHVVRALGSVALVTGVVQVAVFAAAGLLLALAFGMGLVPALYVGIGLAFSSTIVVVKLLSDRKEIDELHGRLAVGILIVQDLLVVLVLIGVTTAGEEGGSLVEALMSVAARSLVFFVVLAAHTRWVLGPIVHSLARESDLLLVFSLAWAIAVAAVGEEVGLGHEVGAFVAGVSLAWTPYRDAIASRLVTLRDVLLLFFFINLGAQLEPGDAAAELPVALVLAAFVLVAKPVLVAVLLVWQRYRSRVALETGLSLAQISEFSLILAALGLSLGHIETDTATLLTVTALITIAASSYLILDSEALARRLAPRLEPLERAEPRDEPELGPDELPEVVLFGLGRFGEGIATGLRERGIRVLGVDFDPIALSRWAEGGIDVFYGDAEDPELAGILPLPESGWVVSTMRRADANLALLAALDQHGYKGKRAVAAHSRIDAERLREAGADEVFLPYVSAAKEVVEFVTASPELVES